MAIVRDCGDFEAKLGFTIGLDFFAYVPKADQAKLADKLGALSAELQAKREKMELELLDFVCDQLGYPEEVVAQKLADRDAEQHQKAVAEAAGRAHKTARRAGR